MAVSTQDEAAMEALETFNQEKTFFMFKSSQDEISTVTEENVNLFYSPKIIKRGQTRRIFCHIGEIQV